MYECLFFVFCSFVHTLLGYSDKESAGCLTGENIIICFFSSVLYMHMRTCLNVHKCICMPCHSDQATDIMSDI